MSRLVSTIALITLLTLNAAAQNSASKPLTNDDVVSLLKGGLEEGTVISPIKSEPTQFDLSAPALLKLKQDGVGSKVMDAMMAPAPTSVPSNTSASSAASATPSVVLLQATARQELPASKTQLVQTKTKSASLSALASDGALAHAMTSTATRVATMAALRGGSVMGASVLSNAGGLMGGFMSHRKPTVTEVWALPGQKSETQIHENSPSFEVNFANIPGVNAGEFEPVLVKLTPSNTNFRLVGATQARQDVFESSAMDWEVYSSFVEERVSAQPRRIAPGQYQLQPSAALQPGEYGVVLRPLNKSKKFSATGVSQDTGDGLAFNSVWGFSVSN
jgi:hypothetical protein